MYKYTEVVILISLENSLRGLIYFELVSLKVIHAQSTHGTRTYNVVLRFC